ncbi:MAG: DivIVA domain-containing protein [Ignavibacteriae bacterium]|nr:DivIVA domain-containing protein [Ignavibacteriota bacterium]
MIISSKDIKKRDFKKAIRGFDTDEVEAFLETVSSHYEKLATENKSLNERIKSLLSDIDIYKENETNLQRAIIKAQNLGEEIIQNSKKRAEIIIRTAELDARRLKQDLEDEIIGKKHELDEIKQKNEKTFDDVRHFLSEKLNDLEDFIKNRKILKMDLTQIRIKDVDTEETTERAPEEEREQTEKPMKKVYLNPQSANTRSFDDSFEIK